MPWTFAHPAAVLPLRRYCPAYFNFAALMIGALTPDFGYYVGQFGIATLAHTFVGSFLVCLPTGMLLLAAFYLVRRPVWYLLPEPHRTALEPFLSRPTPTRFADLARAGLSVLLGAWTHIMWDSFTHRSGWTVVQFPWLPYQELQHVSTVFGVAVLAIAYYFWLRRQWGGSILAARA